MTERGIVKEIDKKSRVKIEFERKTSCDKCGMCAFGKDNMSVSITVKNTLGAKIGDIVEVKMGDKYVLTSAVIVYIIPLLLVALGIFLGSYLGELWQIGFAGLGLVIGFAIASIIDKKVKHKNGFVPTMVKIIAKPDTTDTAVEAE